MRFSLSKESVGYHQVKSYCEVQNLLPLLISTTIPETSMNYLETCACSTYMPIKISSYKKLLTTRYSSNQPSNSFQNCLLALSSRPTWEAYALITLKTISPMTSLTKIILSPYLFIPTTLFWMPLSIKTPTPFLFATVPVYQSLKHVLSTSFAF